MLKKAGILIGSTFVFLLFIHIHHDITESVKNTPSSAPARHADVVIPKIIQETTENNAFANAYAACIARAIVFGGSQSGCITVARSLAP